MRSMTGYGRAACALGGGTLSVQVSSVNRRSLDLAINLPAEWESLEAEIGERVRRVAARGKVNVVVEYAYATDDEVLEAFQLCSRLEGIIPALESTHAIVHALKRARALPADKVIIVNLSGRGDKDVQEVAKLIGGKP